MTAIRRLIELCAAHKSRMMRAMAADALAELEPTLTTRQAAERCGLSRDGFRRAAKVIGVEPIATVAQAQAWRASDVERVRVERRPKGWPKKGASDE